MFDDEYFMKMALAEAEDAFQLGEVPVGAIVVAGGRVIGKGHNLTQQLNDVTAHAEMQAITAASNYLNSKYLVDCKLYVTLEPCVMCAGAIAWAQLGTLVYAASDPKRGYTLLDKPLLHPKTEVIAGVLETKSAQLLQLFFGKLREKT
ncbi:MAG: nucleoside deaminase [Bacteroidales bacterium]|jgi:tRNA(adenine34) deaminase|nr:nucleoside deaminase [Bacteroidales bacterium]